MNVRFIVPVTNTQLSESRIDLEINIYVSEYSLS